MSKTVKIPTSMNPFVVIVNGMKHEYPAGETVEVADHIAEIIEQYEKGNFPQPVLPATEINMVSPGGKAYVLTVSDDGELAVTRKRTGATFTFYIEDIEYEAEAGMTWAEWLKSDYCPTHACNVCGTENRRYAIVGNNIGVMDGCENGTDDDETEHWAYSNVVTLNLYASYEAWVNTDVEDANVGPESVIVEGAYYSE